jgi:hypothetical protein
MQNITKHYQASSTICQRSMRAQTFAEEEEIGGSSGLHGLGGEERLVTEVRCIGLRGQSNEFT